MLRALIFIVTAMCISQISMAGIVESKLAKCDSVNKAEGYLQYGYCVVDANTDILNQTVAAESRLIRLFKACSVKFAPIKGAAPLAKWCQSGIASRHGIIPSLQESIAFQPKTRRNFEDPKTSLASQQQIVKDQIVAIKSNARYFNASVGQLNVSEKTLKSQYKAATGKALTF